ncbi:MAG TPA: helix-turn-helix domain-containing protein [Ureibacillus sp.]|nr:helix-turn-helix domain-containing protein [Ureibacillus sp.]
MARGRKVNSNGEKSKQLLRQKAIELFSTKGYYQTKISDIVKAAEVTQPTFYLYFDSKDALFSDLNRQFQDNLFTIFDEYQSNHDRQLTLIVENLLKYFAANPLLTKIGMYQSEAAYAVKEKLVEKFEQILTVHYRYNLNGLQSDIHIIAQSLMGSIERLTFTLLLTHRKTAKELAHDLLSIYLMDKEELVAG